MGKYRSKGSAVTAHRWFQNGDHPLDNYEKGTGLEGALVKRHRGNEDSDCDKCSLSYSDHGWIDNGNSAVMVCPGDWVVTDNCGNHGAVRDDEFREKYESRFDEGGIVYSEKFAPKEITVNFTPTQKEALEKTIADFSNEVRRTLDNIPDISVPKDRIKIPINPDDMKKPTRGYGIGGFGDGLGIGNPTGFPPGHPCINCPSNGKNAVCFCALPAMFQGPTC